MLGKEETRSQSSCGYDAHSKTEVWVPRQDRLRNEHVIEELRVARIKGEKIQEYRPGWYGRVHRRSNCPVWKAISAGSETGNTDNDMEVISRGKMIECEITKNLAFKTQVVQCI